MNAMHSNQHYGRLAAMVILSFLSMYVLMYAMVDAFANVYPNFNQFYMAGLMTAPMVIVELVLMGSMYEKKVLNAIIVIVSVKALIVFFLLIRQQVGISDEQFLKSMIPHHASALLMCEQANLHDPEIKELCKGIVSGQQSEIDQMRRILERLGE